MITMYRPNKLGVGTWRIWAEGATIWMAHANVLGGAEVLHKEEVPKGLAGRSLEEQVESRIRSRMSRQRDRGYVESLEAARTMPLTNTLNLPPPMLAKKISDIRSWPGKVAVQPKFDGFRCLITRDNEGNVIAYSRQGKVLDALGHITNSFESVLPDGVILDGEIYQHGKPLQVIASLCKREQPGTEKLVYHVYDSVSSDIFPLRYALAKEMVLSSSGPSVIVPNRIVTDSDTVWSHFEEFRSNGYEGAMVRLLSMPYEPGTRSFGLLKVKARHDAEFEVLDVVEGSDGLGILVCKLESGATFKTLAPGNHDQKRFTLVHKEQYVGRFVTVEYANLTRDGIPFHAVATRWHQEL